MNNMTRNLSQTVQERDIVKTAPDIWVHIDGLPYLLNPYIYSGNQQYTLINFNNQVESFQASYDVDSFKPSATVSLSIPNQLKYLYQVPGGNNLVETMSELQVFAKNYFPSANGNSVYSRVFKGVISHVTHTDTGKSLEITIQASGILRFLELMQIDLAPAYNTNSERLAQVLKTNQANLDPYQQIADTFLRGITFEGFQLNSIQQGLVAKSDFSQGVRAGYINKWQSILTGIRKDVHIFGYTFGSVLPLDINGLTDPSVAKGKMGPDKVQASQTLHGKLLESDPAHDLYVSQIRGYLPDFGPSTIQLVNGQIVSRLERIRTIVQAVGMEGFQDINGEIIVKPPLYNLDVTNVTPLTTSSNVSSSKTQVLDINKRFSEQHNPFVVKLSEILGETETEDEQAVRATRVSLQGDWSRVWHMNDGTGALREVASHIDIPKLAMFGLREEPAHQVNWLVSGDKIAEYTYAVSELNRLNRGYRTYQITIPLRPELRLGFPMYFPHKDMYGYIRSVGINYQTRGEATMTILLDTLRKRPLFPSTQTLQTIDSTTNQPQQVVVYTAQPNLVMKWTAPPNTPSASQDSFTQTINSTFTGSSGSSNNGTQGSTDPAVCLVNNPATQLQSPQAPVYDEQVRVINYRRQQLGTEWGTKADTTSKSFRVQNDIETEQDSVASKVAAGQPFFSRSRWLTPAVSTDSPVTGTNGVAATPVNFGIDAIYFQRILKEQPFTDEKGYEVVTPFPWGRWKSLLEAYSETRQGQLVEFVNPQDQQVLNGVNAFLFAGMGTPQGSLEAGSALSDALSNLRSQIESKDSFELAPATSQSPGTESSLLNFQQPEDQPDSDTALLNQVSADLAAKVNLFVQGTVSNPVRQSVLDLAQDAAGNIITHE